MEFDALARLVVLPMVTVTVIKETAKLIAPVVVLVVTRYRHPGDGLLAGVAAGAGFAALETMGYAFCRAGAVRGQPWGAVEELLLLRGLLSPAAHTAWTGLTAAALWRAAERGWSGWGIGGLVGVFVVAVVLHTAWDSVGGPLIFTVIAVVSLGLLAVTTHRLGRDRIARPGAE